MNTTLHYRLDLIEIRPIEGKGFGIFARRDIPDGTLLSAEHPAFVFARDNEKAETQYAEFCETFHNSTAEQQVALRSLHPDWRHLARSYIAFHLFLEWHEKNYDRIGSKLDVTSLTSLVVDAHAKWHTNNGLITSDGTGANTAGAWLNFSRFNHSCDPNADWGCTPTTDSVLTVVTQRDIAAGEEICLSYIPLDGPLQNRRDRLVHWGFVCICPRCVQEESLLKPGERVGGEMLNADIPSFPTAGKIKQVYEEIEKENGVPDLKLFLPDPNYGNGNDGSGGSGGSGGGSPASDATIMAQLQLNYEIELEIIAIERTEARRQEEMGARRQLVIQSGSQVGSQSGSQTGSQHSSPGASKSGSQ